ncbi:MAG: tryptophan--tRNA ligase [Elusimicrobiota bacterium]|nr:tryptophan--tRNA ligase [Elusimicrobiota bacterium]
MDDFKNKKIVVSGMRPTGRLHLGNYWGALKNWVKIQDEYRCIFFIADWHSLTTGLNDTGNIAEYSKEILIDWLAAGLDPDKCIIFRQSDVKEHAELALLLGMATPVSWLLRNPTFKEQLIELYQKKYKGQEENIKAKEGMSQKLMESHSAKSEDIATHSDLSTFGFLGYPILQAADILLYNGDFVPVGKDQLPHLELTREIARKFNHVLGKDIFKEPKALLTEAPLVPGLDTKKMSKSYGNTIELGESEKSLKKKINKMYTDSKKLKADDAGHPGGCVVYAFHKLYNTGFAALGEDCKKGSLACSECKNNLFEIMWPSIKEFSDKRAAFEKDAALLDKILEAGAEKARVVSKRILSKANRAVCLRKK